MALVAGDEPGGPIGSEWPVLWIVWRRDDNGNRFEVARKDSHAEAEALAAAMEVRGRKQTYWVAGVTG